jgi:hypothetical protein
MHSNSSGISAAEIALKRELIFVEDIPDWGFVRRDRKYSNEELTQLTAELGINLADIVIDEENENYNDFIQHCWSFFRIDDEEDNDDITYLKEWLRDVDLNGNDWWNDAIFGWIQPLVHRRHDTPETIGNTLRALQIILRVKEQD